MREALRVRHVLAVSNCTAALHLALGALELAPGDEVIVPSLTYVSSAQAILAAGGKPVFCDVGEQDLLASPEDVARCVTPRTRAVVLVHYGGRVCDVAGVRRTLGSSSIRIVEDAAHAFGSVSGAGPAGSLGDVGCLSFDPIKNITCVEGGAVATNDDEIAAKVRLRRNTGIDSDSWRRAGKDRPWHYEVHDRGLRYLMPNLNAAVGLVQMGKFERFRARRLAIVRRYDNALRGLPGILTLRHDPDGAVPFNYTLRVIDGRRDELEQFLRERGVGSWVHFIPCHSQPLFSRESVRLPVTEKIYPEILCLPLHCELSDSDVEEVIAAVTEFVTTGATCRTRNAAS
ncbi:MAG: DegT/DnrJ/EryC1/StrS family aminotransferase [Bryobacteraceae bacterium]